MYGYQREWYGASKHGLQGRLMIGRRDSRVMNLGNLGGALYVLSLIVALSWLLWSLKYQVSIIFTLLVYAIMIINICLSAFSDPGVLLRPRNYLSLKQAEDIKQDLEIKKMQKIRTKQIKLERIELEQKLMKDELDIETINQRLSNYDRNKIGLDSYDCAKRVYTNLFLEKEEKLAKEAKLPSIFTERYGKTCMIWRPPKASHCPTCNHGVKDWDHHCDVINACVGKRNIRSFFYMMLSSALLSLLITYLTFEYYRNGMSIVKAHDQEYYKKNKPEILLVAILMIIGIFCVIISYMGFIVCGIFGIAGLLKVIYDIYIVLKPCMSLSLNVYPLTGIFIIPLFYIVNFQVVNYLKMIYKGANQKIQGSISKFNFEHSTTYVNPTTGKELFEFFGNRKIPKSELRREMTVDAVLEYELPSDNKEEMKQ